MRRVGLISRDTWSIDCCSSHQEFDVLHRSAKLFSALVALRFELDNKVCTRICFRLSKSSEFVDKSFVGSQH